MKVPLLDLKAQYKTIKDEVLAAIAEVCESQHFALGPAVEKFEQQIAAYCGAPSAVGVSSGTDALLISLMAIDIQPGDEIITTPFTFFATAGSITRRGGRPVFVDVEEKSFNINPAGIEAAITDRTKAILPVHLFGQMAPMKPIMDVAGAHDLRVIEDCAQAIGAHQDGRIAGSVGDLGCFSFYPTKNLSAYGDGGLVVTRDEELGSKLKVLRDHGQSPRYFYKMVGGNFRLDAIQAAVLNVKLKYIDAWNARRREIAAQYDKLLADTPVTVPQIEDENVSVYHQYTLEAPRRDELQAFLQDNGVGCAVFYPKPLHLQDCFSDLGYTAGDMPVAESLCKKVLSLPIFPELTEEQIAYVAEQIARFYESN